MKLCPLLRRVNVESVIPTSREFSFWDGLYHRLLRFRFWTVKLARSFI